jgi:hypothetical protein
MTLEDIKILWHKSTGANRFGYWISIRNNTPKRGIAGRKSAITFFENQLGPMGTKWQYQKCDESTYILKLDDERDFLFFLLRIK